MKLSPPPASALRDLAGALGASTLADASPLWLRRAAFVIPIMSCTAVGTWLAVMATAGSSSALRPVLLVLVALNLLYVALTGWPTVLGFALHVFRRRLSVTAAPSGATRTALLMPVYNEDPRAVFAAIEAMGRAVAEAGLDGVDLFVLSDTRDEAIAARELSEFAQVQARLPEGPSLFYRRRTDNAGRKVGNVLDFCRRWGRDYDYMLVLDADSLMGASAISRLIGLMDANPRAGIIQTVPYAVGRETPFARFQQFSARLYTPLLVEGLTFWQQGDGNFWGHNAIVRIVPFVERCALPVLPGREPFGGEILCHDVVEAGLMRAAGWQVWVLPETLESFEAVPANLVDFAGRERRWCQGNLQHTGVLSDRRLRPVGRFHLAYGVMHYVAGPVAALFLALTTLDAMVGGDFAERLLLADGAAQWGLIALTATLLYVCKAAALATVLTDGAEARKFGGRWRILASAAVEQLGALIITGVLITFYTRFIAALLGGASVRWEAQPRDDRGLSWREAWTRLKLPTFVGAAWLAMLACTSTGLLLWCAPLLFGLLLCVPAAYVSSRVDAGRSASRAGLFRIPEETAPPAVLRAFQRSLQPGEPLPRPRAAAPALHLADAD